MKDQSEQKVENPAEVFVKKYNELVEKYGYQILSNPAFRMRDDGTWSVVMQTQVAKLPEKKS